MTERHMLEVSLERCFQSLFDDIIDQSVEKHQRDLDNDILMNSQRIPAGQYRSNVSAFFAKLDVPESVKDQFFGLYDTLKGTEFASSSVLNEYLVKYLLEACDEILAKIEKMADDYPDYDGSYLDLEFVSYEVYVISSRELRDSIERIEFNEEKYLSEIYDDLEEDGFF